MTDKEKIRAEIERRMKGRCPIVCSYIIYEDILNFIDSMQEEPVSEDLEKVARKYAGIPEDSPHDLKYCVQDKKAKYDAVLYGAQWQKEQMMKQSVGGKVIARFPLASDPFYDDVEIYLNFTKGLSEGDKVKVIIVKYEQSREIYK